MMPRVLGVVLVLSVFGCAHVPKPQELLDLSTLREGKDYAAARDKQPELVKQSDDSYWKAVESWKDEDLDLSKYWSVLGTVKLRTALSILKEEVDRQRVTNARKQLVELKAQARDLRTKIADADEQLRLHAKLDSARRNASETDAQKRVTEAQLALKMADTVEAAKYAPTEYGIAQTLLTRAEAALKEGKSNEAVDHSGLAKSKAEAALALARPQYVAARRTAERHARHQALQRDAAAMDGITIRMKAVADTQQMIVPVLNLFRRSEAAPRPDKIALLNEIGALLKKYAEYPVVINGFTSSRVRISQQYSVSHARAQQVANHFVSLGVDFKRMAVAGRAAEEPVGPKRSTANDRVEIVILFQ
jgi:flagellar motor protein MotB